MDLNHARLPIPPLRLFAAPGHRRRADFLFYFTGARRSVKHRQVSEVSDGWRFRRLGIPKALTSETSDTSETTETLLHCTCSVTVVDFATAPDVAFTVMEYED